MKFDELMKFYWSSEDVSEQDGYIKMKNETQHLLLKDEIVPIFELTGSSVEFAIGDDEQVELAYKTAISSFRAAADNAVKDAGPETALMLFVGPIIRSKNSKFDKSGSPTHVSVVGYCKFALVKEQNCLDSLASMVI